MDDVIAAARAVLELTPARWRAIADRLPAELIAREPAPGEWTALGCLQHLVDTERDVFPTRVHAFLAGHDFADYDPDAAGVVEPGQRSATELASELERLRGQALELFNGFVADDLGRMAKHSRIGLVTLSELLHEWAAHDLMHTVQAERALMQPFIDGCGPWQSYFSDHIAGAKG